MGQQHVGRVLMEDVAQRAGVSVTTVSHVLNNVPGKRIRPETRDRVRRTADELGYVLNEVARSLRTRRSHVIAMIGDEVAITPFAVGIILGAQEAASRLGWLIVHIHTGVDRILEEAEIRSLRKRQVDGFLYVRMYHQEVIMPSALQGLPTVLVDGTCSDPLIPSIVPDEFSGGCTATRELIRYGHTAIAFINNIDDIVAARGRLAGYRSALEEAGLELRPEYVVSETPDAVGGLRAARRLLSLPNRPTGVFCFSDRMAMGVYHAAHERGLRIPDDVSVIGFDNQIAVGDGLFPGLTTVALPHYEMGAWGARTLIHQLEDPQEGGVEHVALACPLITRGSISEPPVVREANATARLGGERAVRTGGNPVVHQLRGPGSRNAGLLSNTTKRPLQ
jgi:LacI family transcriptional regulator